MPTGFLAREARRAAVVLAGGRLAANIVLLATATIAAALGPHGAALAIATRASVTVWRATFSLDNAGGTAVGETALGAWMAAV
jgi:hypothetical protein